MPSVTATGDECAAGARCRNGDELCAVHTLRSSAQALTYVLRACLNIERGGGHRAQHSDQDRAQECKCLSHDSSQPRVFGTPHSFRIFCASFRSSAFENKTPRAIGRRSISNSDICAIIGAHRRRGRLREGTQRDQSKRRRHDTVRKNPFRCFRPRKLQGEKSGNTLHPVILGCCREFCLGWKRLLSALHLVRQLIAAQRACRDPRP